jgi:hypothetical protein
MVSMVNMVSMVSILYTVHSTIPAASHQECRWDRTPALVDSRVWQRFSGAFVAWPARVYVQ